MLHLKNRVQLIGFLGMDPEVKHLSDGKILARVSLATNDSYKNQQGTKINETQWHNLVAWGKTAEIAEKYFKKGKEVAVEGKLATRSYEDKQGVRKYVTEVIVNNILLGYSQTMIKTKYRLEGFPKEFGKASSSVFYKF